MHSLKNRATMMKPTTSYDEHEMGYVLQQNILFLQKPKKLLRSV
jgi:hypothetical protein